MDVSDTKITYTNKSHDGQSALFFTCSFILIEWHRRYDMLSATTGVEIIQIPETFSSPVRVGVFASAQYINTSYSLEVSSGNAFLSTISILKLILDFWFKKFTRNELTSYTTDHVVFAISDDPLTGNKKYPGKDTSSWSWGDVFWFILEIVFEIMV